MSRYLRLIRTFARTSFQAETAFRAHFFTYLFNTVLGLGTELAGLGILFSQVESFQGWTYGRALILLGVYLLVNILLDINLWISMNTLGGEDGEVFQGTFDFTLLKPLNTQFYISFRTWDIWRILDLPVGMVIIGWGMFLLDEPLRLGAILGFLLMLLIAVCLGYSLILILETCVFYYLGAPLTWIFSTLYNMGRYPITIYPDWIRTILTWIVPVAFMTTIPTQALTGSASTWMVLAGFVLAVVLFMFASFFFHRSLRRYMSASS